jgi:AraC-like DNA-binding protein/quercetin dioxygenase-like cupin family protein
METSEPAVVCHANYARFVKGQVIVNRAVESRMSLWCKEGRGRVVVNGKSYEFHAGDYLFLPWRHRIEYYPDASRPFLLAGIHLVPRHDLGHPVEYAVPHQPDHPLTGCAWRQDADLSPLTGVVSFRLQEEAPLWLLSEYIVRLFLSTDWKEGRMRVLAAELIRELTRTWRIFPQTVNPRSAADFHRVCDHITAHLGLPLALADLAACLRCSEPTVTRLFRAQAQLSPVNWINQARVRRARHLLTTTRLPVAEIGRLVGVPDPFYFSKLFKKWTGESPLAYRRRTPLL